MKTKPTKFIIAIIIAFFAASFISLKPADTHAISSVDICSQSGISKEVREANGCDGADASGDLRGVITGIINGVIGILGAVAAIFILIGGINYMTSAGDASKIEKAKKTILWAVIGLIIAALTFAIVNLVIVNILGQS